MTQINTLQHAIVTSQRENDWHAGGRSHVDVREHAAGLGLPGSQIEILVYGLTHGHHGRVNGHFVSHWSASLNDLREATRYERSTLGAARRALCEFQQAGRSWAILKQAGHRWVTNWTVFWSLQPQEDSLSELDWSPQPMQFQPVRSLSGCCPVAVRLRIDSETNHPTTETIGKEKDGNKNKNTNRSPDSAGQRRTAPRGVRTVTGPVFRSLTPEKLRSLEPTLLRSLFAEAERCGAVTRDTYEDVLMFLAACWEAANGQWRRPVGRLVWRLQSGFRGGLPDAALTWAREVLSTWAAQRRLPCVQDVAEHLRP